MYRGDVLQFNKVEICGVNTAKLKVLKESENDKKGKEGLKTGCSGKDSCLLYICFIEIYIIQTHTYGHVYVYMYECT